MNAPQPSLPPGPPVQGRSIDLNADVGEQDWATGLEAELLSLVTSANIACGGHAGDAVTMREVARVCRALGVGIGAHPSFPDRVNFGRIDLPLPARAIEATVAEQIATLGSIVRALGAELEHVKPHGALYHAASGRLEVADAIARAAQAWRSGLRLVGQAGSPALARWRQLGAPVLAEAFADRRYEPDGTLRARGRPGALLTDAAEVAAQAVRLARGEGALAADGAIVPVGADTICLHGDTPGAVAHARAVRQALAAAGISVRRAARG